MLPEGTPYHALNRKRKRENEDHEARGRGHEKKQGKGQRKRDSLQANGFEGPRLGFSVGASSVSLYVRSRTNPSLPLESGAVVHAIRREPRDCRGGRGGGVRPEWGECIGQQQ
jgi:hypothetical protein